MNGEEVTTPEPIPVQHVVITSPQLAALDFVAKVVQFMIMLVIGMIVLTFVLLVVAGVIGYIASLG